MFQSIFTLENCKRVLHVLIVVASTLEHHVHVHAEHEFELVLSDINSRRSLSRAL